MKRDIYDIKVITAKNNEVNLVVNEQYYYSKYDPKKDIKKFIFSKIDKDCRRYILVGVGLGYHIESLLEQDNKEIIVLETEKELFNYVKVNGYIKEYLVNPRVKFVHSFNELIFTIEDCLIIIPAWKRHLCNPKLKLLVEQLEFEYRKGSNSNDMLLNFQKNIETNWTSIRDLQNSLNDKAAILVSAGPDLDNQIEFLKKAKKKAYILCVSAAYKTLKNNRILPDGIVAIDQRVEFAEQLDETALESSLFMLSTVHPSFTMNLNQKFLLFQMGLEFVEDFAAQTANPLIESHGSVATAGLSLLQYFGAKQVIFIGQDLAMYNNKTHASHSSSNSIVPSISRYKTLSNSGEEVETQLQWLIFKRHIEKMIKNSPHIKYVNTSYLGAEIMGAKYCEAYKIVFDK